MAGNPTVKSPLQTHDQRTSHPLRVCDKCESRAENTGGVEVRGKWYCAKCWIKFVNGR